MNGRPGLPIFSPERARPEGAANDSQRAGSEAASMGDLTTLLFGLPRLAVVDVIS